jgi:hypothetical protein
MASNEKKQTKLKSEIIANPIYNTVFKQLMEDTDIVKFFLSTIFGIQVTDVAEIDDLPDVYRQKKNKEQKKIPPYSAYRTYFMVTVLTGDGERRILIEIQNSFDMMNRRRFRKYLESQYSKKITVINNDSEPELPVTSIYILENILSEIKFSCLKVGRTDTDILTDEPVAGMDDFLKKLPRNSYIIKKTAEKSCNSTALEKLLGLFEQSSFLFETSKALKTYQYLPSPDGDEDIKLITDTLHGIAACSEDRKEIEYEAEYIRTTDFFCTARVREAEIELERLDKELERLDKEKEKQDKELERLDKEKERLDKEKEKQDKEKERQAKRIAELERLLQDKQSSLITHNS